MPRPVCPALVIIAIAALSSCDITRPQQAFYVSPYNGSSQGYHTLSMHTDTVTTAAYVRVSGFGGDANDLQNDHFGGANASFYVTHHGAWWQAYYGLDGTLGGYTLGNWQERHRTQNFNLLTLNPLGELFQENDTYTPPARSDQLNIYTGAYTFGGMGFSGGFNAVAPMGQGEWRFLGIETALHQEFGEYRHLREKMPDSIAGYINRNSFYGTLGLTTEFIFRTKTGDFGFRLADGWVLGNGYATTGVYDSAISRPLHYGSYGTFTAHYTFGRYTVYYQTEFASKAFSTQLGFVYRFGDPKLPARKIIHRERPAFPPERPRPRRPFEH